MKKIILLTAVMFLYSNIDAQKKALDFSDNDTWPQISNWHITADGKYASYSIRDTLVLQSTGNTFKKKVQGASDIQFNDEGYFSYITKEHELVVGKLTDSTALTVHNVQSRKLLTIDNRPWVVYLTSDSCKSLIFQNLIDADAFKYDSVLDYFFNADQTIVLIKTRSPSNEKKTLNNLLWVVPSRRKCYKVVTGLVEDIGNFWFDKPGTQLAFVVSKSSGGEVLNEVYYFKPGMPLARSWINNKTRGIDSGMAIENAEMHFSNDGMQFFFSLQKKTIKNIKNTSTVSLDVWSSQDVYLQSQQLNGDDGRLIKGLMAVYNIKTDFVNCLQYSSDDAQSFYISQGAPDGYRLVQTGTNQIESYFREPPSLFLVSTATGQRTLLTNSVRVFDPRFSLSGKYVIYFDRGKKNYFSYDIQNKKTVNITERIPYPVFDDKDDMPRKPVPINMNAVVGWLEDDKGVLINDEFDIWLVDPTGSKSPINLTSGYGRKHKIILRCLQNKGMTLSWDPFLVNSKESLLFIAFNQTNKYNGFYRKNLFDRGNPEELFMGPYIFHFPFNNYGLLTNEPLKAKRENIFLVKRMNSATCSNIYCTRDFKNFIQLSDVNPQRQFNWYTTELIRWKMFDGKVSEGILYKPENFDPSKKYPIIFTFYERNADKLNQFLYPRNSRGELNIPYYVSNGYLVFVPNIYYSIGLPAQSVYNSVVSAAEVLSSKPWVDKRKMGLEGISFGGYEVNVLITRTKLFAVAVETAGPVDLVSGYGSLNIETGASLQFLYEDYQVRIGKTLWQNRKAYIDNSPIFDADKVTTPLLIMHNKLDYSVPWSQGVEWFTALRRLGKQVWMLQYDGEDHGISRRSATIDYTIRQAQFFNHYLKSGPLYKWMTRGIDASKKGLDYGLEVDTGKNIFPSTTVNK